MEVLWGYQEASIGEAGTGIPYRRRLPTSLSGGSAKPPVGLLGGPDRGSSREGGLQACRGRLPAILIATGCGLHEGAFNYLLVYLAYPPDNISTKHEVVRGHDCRSAWFRVARPRGGLYGELKGG